MLYLLIVALLNALLYGNTDESLNPRKFQRGTTPDGAKLPRGVKAITSSKPGQTKELSFYQLTADVVTENDDSAEKEASRELGKMAMLLVDLPGYGFAFAKEERTVEWRDLMHHYLLERKTLKRILLLLDARHGFKKTDFDFLGDLQDGMMAKSGSKKVRDALFQESSNQIMCRLTLRHFACFSTLFAIQARTATNTNNPHKM